jgi:hypothetical protein
MDAWLLLNRSNLPSDPNQQPSFEDDKDVRKCYSCSVSGSFLMLYRSLRRRTSPDRRGRVIPPISKVRIDRVPAITLSPLGRRIDNLDKQVSLESLGIPLQSHLVQLQNFANATRQLGSSVAILSSALHLQGRIAQILFLYRENAADLFPRKITHASRETVVDPTSKGRRRVNSIKVYSAPPRVARPALDESVDLVRGSSWFVFCTGHPWRTAGKLPRAVRGISQQHCYLWSLLE